MENAIMTNEEKALELFPDTPALECLCKGVREKLVEMANWKDEEYKKGNTPPSSPAKLYVIETNSWSPDCWGRMEDSGWEILGSFGVFATRELAEKKKPKDYEGTGYSKEFRVNEINVITE